MKEINKQIFDNIKNYRSGQNPYLVTTDLIPRSVNGYRITFVPLNAPLAKNIYAGKNGEPYMSTYPDWVMGRYTQTERHETFQISYTQLTNEKVLEKPSFYVSEEINEANLYMYASDEGLEIVNNLGWKFFQDNPEQKLFEMSNEEVGSGAESLVRKIKISGNDYILKVRNSDFVDMLNSLPMASHISYPEANYLHKFGITEQVSNILLELQNRFGFKSFELEVSPKDILAGNRFLIQEEVGKVSVNTIKEMIEKKAKSTKNKSKENWKVWFNNFQKDIDELKEIFAVLAHERGGVFDKTDFEPQNWMIKGFYKETNKLKLSLIDQASAGTTFAGMMEVYHYASEEERYKELSKKHNDSEKLSFLKNYE